jgi:hypothetical protein
VCVWFGTSNAPALLVVVELDEVGAQLGGSLKNNINILMRQARFESAKLPRAGHIPYPAQVEGQRSLPRILTPLLIIGWTPVESSVRSVHGSVPVRSVLVRTDVRLRSPCSRESQLSSKAWALALFAGSCLCPATPGPWHWGGECHSLITPRRPPDASVPPSCSA